MTYNPREAETMRRLADAHNNAHPDPEVVQYASTPAGGTGTTRLAQAYNDALAAQQNTETTTSEDD